MGELVEFIQSNPDPRELKRALAVQGVKSGIGRSMEAGADVGGALHRAIAIERKTEQRLLTGRTLSIGELQALFNVYAQDKSVKGIRDAALIAVLYSTGLRRSEVAVLDLSD